DLLRIDGARLLQRRHATGNHLEEREPGEAEEQQPDGQRDVAAGARRLDTADVDLHAVVAQVGDERRVRGDVAVRRHRREQLAVAPKVGQLVGVDRDLLDLVRLHVTQELRERDVDRLRHGRRAEEQYPDDGDDDDGGTDA